MKLIKPSFQILEQKPEIDGIYEQIELAGRTCYRSKRPEGQTAKNFVDRMIASQHYAMLEHGTVYLKIPYGEMDEDGRFENEYLLQKYLDNPYSRVTNNIIDDSWFVTSNMRVLVEHNWLDDLKYLCEPTEFHEKRVTVRFTTDQGVLREFTRHRTFSFAVESTRYCNYSKDKFGNDITCIIPTWLDYLDEGEYTTKLGEPTSGVWFNGKFLCSAAEHRDLYFFIQSLNKSCREYIRLTTELGWKPEQARNILPLATKCDMVMAGFVSDWKHFFDLRALGTTGKPHPQAKELAEPLMNKFIKRGLI